MRTLDDLREELVRCLKCGNCRPVCPVFQDTTRESSTARAKVRLIRAALEGELAISPEFRDRMFGCLVCNGCVAACPSGVKVDELVLAIRAHLAAGGDGLPAILRDVGERIVTEGNPFGSPRGERDQWLPPALRAPHPAESVYFVGCSTSYASNRIGKAVLRLLEAAKVDFTCLGVNEQCCGDPLFRMGAVEAGERMVGANRAALQELGIKRVIVSCAGCLKSIKEHYGDWFEVRHITQVLAEAAESGDLSFAKPLKKRVAFFDGCDLGRHSGVYDEPRAVLRAVPELELVEMPNVRADAFCCGGPLTASEPELARRIAARRIQEAHCVGAEALITACPTCLVHLREGAREARLDVEVADLMVMLTPLVAR